MPSDCAPRQDCANAREMVKSLGLLGDSRMTLHNLSSGPVFNECKKQIVVCHQVIRDAIEGCFVGVSPVGHQQLLTLATREQGSRQLCLDGNGGVCKDPHTLIVLGGLSVKCRQKQDRVSSSL